MNDEQIRFYEEAFNRLLATVVTLDFILQTPSNQWVGNYNLKSIVELLRDSVGNITNFIDLFGACQAVANERIDKLEDNLQHLSDSTRRAVANATIY